jgi:hypothetical protein
MLYFPPARKHGRVTSILKLGKGPGLTSFQTISLLDTIGKLFDKILLTRILSEVSRRGFLHNEQFEFGSKESTILQLACRVERVPGTWKRRGLQAHFSRMWLRHSILYGSTVSSTS